MLYVMSQCPPVLKYSCGPNHPYTTATVFQADSPDYVYSCQEYCKDGCCYLFNPNLHPSLEGPGAIAGWFFFAMCLVFAFCTVVHFIRVFAALRPHEIWRFCGHIVTTYIALSASFLTSGILLDLASHTNTQVSLSWSFPPSSAGKLGMALSSLMLVLTVGMSVAVTSVVTQARTKTALIDRFDNAGNAASALVALIAVCLIPLVAGWDHSSGLAFTDQAPSQQIYIQNTERYDRLIALQGILLGLGISFVTKTLFQMLLKVVLG